MNYCYTLECGDGTYYTGWTNDIKKRYQAHCDGKGAKYTKGRGPFQIVCLECFDTKEEAMRREYEMKRCTKLQKKKIIEQHEEQTKTLLNDIFTEQ